jgi:hypothetical protein
MAGWLGDTYTFILRKCFPGSICSSRANLGSTGGRRQGVQGGKAVLVVVYGGWSNLAGCWLMPKCLELSGRVGFGGLVW